MNTTLKGRTCRSSKQKVENSNLEEHLPPIATKADQRTMAQLLQAPTEGYEDAIVVPKITADNFELNHGLLTFVQNKQFYGHDKEDPHAHIRYFNKITSTLKFPNVPNTFSELHQLDTFYNALTPKDQDSLNSAVGGNFLDKMPSDCLSIIESKSKVRYLRDKTVTKVSTNISTFGVSPDVAKLKDLVRALLLDKKGQNQPPAPVKAIEESCVTCRGAHSYYNYPAIDGNIYQDNIQEFVSQASAAPAYQAPAPQTHGVSKEDFLAYVKSNDAVMKNMQTQGQNMQNQLTNLTDLMTKFVNSNTASTSSSSTLPSNTIANPKSNLKAITTQSGVSNDGPSIQPPAVPSKPVTSEPANTPVSAAKTNPQALIPYPSKRNDERNREKAKDQIEKFYQIFKDISFKISFVDALILMTKFASTLKALIGNIEKLSDMARTPLNEHCSTVLLKKLPEKLGDPGKFLISFDFQGMAECLALADLAEDVYVKVGSFLKTGRALIDAFKGELTLQVGKEAITFNLDQTLRYSANYNDMTANRIDFIDMDYEEYSQDVLGFSDTISSGNPTLIYDPIVSATSPTLTLFGDKGDILLLEVFLNNDTSPPPSNQRNYLPEVRMELKIFEAKTKKSSVDEQPTVELKALPPHLEYAFLECDHKLPVIIVKDLSVEEKAALITVLKSHKRAIAWRFSDIKGINPEFCNHKILLGEDFTPAVQHQRRVNPKIHDVIKQEVIKLLDAGLIYPISDSSWVSHVHCVPKKRGFTVVENEENELIPTRLVTGWRVCIDYRKLNEATRKDHFPLPFMDQMLERLAGNQYYYFLDGFSSYFQIPIDPKDQEKTSFTCPYRTFAYRRLPFGLCNGPRTFQRCMMAIFHDMIEKTIEVFMDDLSVFGDSFQSCLFHLKKMLKRCEDTNLCLNWGKSHFMVKEGVVIGHNISKKGIEAIIRQRRDKHFRPIHYAIVDTKGAENMAADYLSRLENPHQNVLDPKEINESFPLETLNLISFRGSQSENRASWSDKLDDALWAFCTAYKTPIECTLYKLVYEKACHLPVELEHKAYWALKLANFDLKTAGDHRKIQINELSELRDQAYENSLIYKEKTKRIHDSKIKNRVFNIGDRIFSGKLKSRWSGPFTISQVFPYGTVELSQTNGPNFKVNGHRIKHYFGKDIPLSVVPDLQTFANDH
nr:reverse transcriptase domain-containing protein [Tanacetum cinerariifolium]